MLLLFCGIWHLTWWLSNLLSRHAIFHSVLLLLRPDGKLLILFGSYLIVKALAIWQVDPKQSFSYFRLLIYRHLFSLFPVYTGVIHTDSSVKLASLCIPRVYGVDLHNAGQFSHSSQLKKRAPTKGLAFLSLIILFRMMFPHRADPSSATVTKNRFNGWDQCCNEGECVDLPVDQHVKRHENQVFEFTTTVIDNQSWQ